MLLNFLHVPSSYSVQCTPKLVFRFYSWMLSLEFWYWLGRKQPCTGICALYPSRKRGRTRIRNKFEDS